MFKLMYIQIYTGKRNDSFLKKILFDISKCFNILIIGTKKMVQAF